MNSMEHIGWGGALPQQQQQPLYAHYAPSAVAASPVSSCASNVHPPPPAPATTAHAQHTAAPWTGSEHGSTIAWHHDMSAGTAASLMHGAGQQPPQLLQPSTTWHQQYAGGGVLTPVALHAGPAMSSAQMPPWPVAVTPPHIMPAAAQYQHQHHLQQYGATPMAKHITQQQPGRHSGTVQQTVQGAPPAVGQGSYSMQPTVVYGVPAARQACSGTLSTPPSVAVWVPVQLPLSQQPLAFMMPAGQQPLVCVPTWQPVERQQQEARVGRPHADATAETQTQPGAPLAAEVPDSSAGGMALQHTSNGLDSGGWPANPGLTLVEGARSIGQLGWAAAGWATQSLLVVAVMCWQFQLLLLLSLLWAAAAAQRAWCAAVQGALWGARLADREARLFIRAAATVAFSSDVRQLCRQLAVQSVPSMAASQQASRAGSIALLQAAAVPEVDSASRRMSMDGAVRRQSSARGSLRSPFAADTAATAAQAGTSDPEAELSRPLLLLDSLALVSGLQAGLCVRVGLLLTLHAPLRAARVWLSACTMSLAAAARSVESSVHLVWMLAQLSLHILSGAVAAAGGGHAGRVAAPAAAKTAHHGAATSDSSASATCWSLLHTLSAWLAAARALSLQGVGFLLLRSTAAAAAAAGLAGVQLAEALAAVLAAHLLKGAPPMTRTAVLGSARVVRSMMAEALRQTWLLAGQLCEAWQTQQHA